jgi:hypothetical protein
MYLYLIPPTIICKIYLTASYKAYSESTLCEYFRHSAEVVVLRMRAVLPCSLASHRRKYEKSR